MYHPFNILVGLGPGQPQDQGLDPSHGQGREAEHLVLDQDSLVAQGITFTGIFSC